MSRPSLNENSHSAPADETAEPIVATGGQNAAGPQDCDLVMKGGITSGVVYPLAIAELSKRYRFRQIGGSSAGAIAAVLTAAAEYRRAQLGGQTVVGATYPAPYGDVASIPNVLAKEDTLLKLFNPDPKAEGVFRFLIAVLDKEHGVPIRALKAARVVVASAWVPFLVGVLAVFTPAWIVGASLTGGRELARVTVVSLLVWLPAELAVGLLAAGVAAALGAHRVIVHNGFGLTKGHAGAPQAVGSTPPLTDWLEQHIQTLAAVNDRPLAFGDLWGDEATAEYWERVGLGPDGQPSKELPDLTSSRVESDRRIRFDPRVDLKVMTTCLTQGLPFGFPFTDDTFHYCPTCWQDYFSDTVITWLADHQRGGSDWKGIAKVCPVHPETALRNFPHTPHIPIVIAARLSLSFPLLISAVPLCYPDFGKVPSERDVVLSWFSDGGITSNFPVHFFDTVLPGRPTFGIAIEEFDPRYGGTDVGLPNPAHVRGPRERPITGLVDFLAAVVTTMQGWSDTMQAAAPGFRDRIVEIYLKPDEGGLNLRMPPQTITGISVKGGQGGQALRDQFDMPTHRWIRFRIAMNALGAVLDQFGGSLDDFTAAVPPPYTGARYLLGPEEALVRAEAQGLSAVATNWRTAGFPASDGSPSPAPLFRLAPRR